ncbi:SoxY-related AACIE arm protein [Ancylobacter dichloromethanicus]|uniref:Sulfur oxidation protein SoxY n=1 Tax=Ancylobacter dichloromethanicus TaxID=518825 RepID=A0A9W6MXJ1_9HYPH|nr:SoxY-related AACIE arm protein [Ancylobacter dichloromethanicus]MBS7556358.1 SoxY-related AACIE arm protein [Ancylobacter dichloromethanicus]GLK70123.1 sulfur oxidation protein SoxY [Ancylobacter dichloromethanicus]
MKAPTTRHPAGLEPAGGPSLGRRAVLAGGVGIIVMALPLRALARPSLQEAVAGFTGGAPVNAGRVKLTVPPLVENGNAVGVTVEVESPMSEASHVRRIGLFNEKNPQADVAVFRLGPRNGRARIATRIRLATSQTLLAVAELSDGTYWSSEANVIVTLAACIEDLS